MSKAKHAEATNEAAPGEYGPLTASEWDALPDDVRQRRAKRAYEKFLAIKGTIHLNIDVDELRGRNRR